MKPLAIAVAALCASRFAFAAPDAVFDAGTSSWPMPRAEAPTAGHKASSDDRRVWLVVPASNAAQRTAVADSGVAIEEVSPDQVGGIGTESMAQDLRRLGFVVATWPLDPPLERDVHTEDFPREDAAFHNYARLSAALKAIAETAPGLASVFSIGKSIEGRDLWALRLNTSAASLEPSAKPGILFLGTHHAREHLSTEIPLLLARHLIENRDKPEIRSLLAERDVYFVPMVNPDGVEYDIRDGNYSLHRKNMRPLGIGGYGVDLNRNYGFHWGEGGSSANPRSDTYRGPSAFSEPETRAVKAFIESRDNLKVLLSYHTYSELILYPWGHTDAPLSDQRALAAYTNMAQAMGAMTGYKPQQSSRLYINSGDTTDWAWGEHGIFSFTFELTPKANWLTWFTGGFYPGAGAIAETFRANIRPALYLIDLADDPYRAQPPGGPAK